MAHVFIAYHHTQVEFAYAVGQQLEAAGFTVWINPDPEAGHIWYDGWIDPAIRASFALIVIMTPAAKASEYIAYEWACGWGAGVAVIPVVAEAVDLHPRLAAFEPLDFVEGQPWDDLIRRVRERADIYSVGAIPVPEDAPFNVQQLASALNSACAEDRLAAVQTLAGIDHLAARRALEAAVQHPIYRDVRLAAVDAWAKVGGEDAIPTLLLALRDPDDQVGRAAAQALSVFGDAAIPGLIETARDETIRIGRRMAIWALSEIASPATVPGLIEGLGMGGWFAPRTSAVTLGRIGDARAVPALIEALSSEDRSLRALAAVALRQIGTPEAVAAVEQFERASFV